MQFLSKPKETCKADVVDCYYLAICDDSPLKTLHKLIFFSSHFTLLSKTCLIPSVLLHLIKQFKKETQRTKQTLSKNQWHLRCCGSTLISHLKTAAYLAVQLHRSKCWPNYSITPSFMVSMAARCIFPRDAAWRNECLINHHPGNNTPSSLCRMCQTLTRTLGEISLPVQPQPLIWT